MRYLLFISVILFSNFATAYENMPYENSLSEFDPPIGENVASDNITLKEVAIANVGDVKQIPLPQVNDDEQKVNVAYPSPKTSEINKPRQYKSKLRTAASGHAKKHSKKKVVAHKKLKATRSVAGNLKKTKKVSRAVCSPPTV